MISPGPIRLRVMLLGVLGLLRGAVFADERIFPYEGKNPGTSSLACRNSNELYRRAINQSWRSVIHMAVYRISLQSSDWSLNKTIIVPTLSSSVTLLQSQAEVENLYA